MQSHKVILIKYDVVNEFPGIIGGLEHLLSSYREKSEDQVILSH
jgi:hypothetical protein